MREIIQAYRGMFHMFFFTPLVGEECSNTLLDKTLALDLSVFSDQCFSLAVSKTLGLGIVVGSSIVKVPQILKIVAAENADGVSLVAYVLETLALIITLAYNIRKANPFSTFGEIAFISLQNVVILLLLTTYAKKYVSLLATSVFFAATTYVLVFSDVITSELLTSLQWVSIIVATASKVPQIYENWANGRTGQLSLVTVGLQFAGSAARIFTTLREVKDQAILASFLISTALNGVLFLQVLLSLTKAKKEEMKIKKE
ncbi:hypothetical protein HK100_003100 [Physocladia obscura]|uniref:Mannose-P-dolichol utilization defect 1 protein homolog n=1 Tax=Physocladia obscura TaxID=109957 RepID=A0AAD5XAM3_9FUNG|nr:hypothetical protein HK100_003100 [Physocladia obscura]